MSQKILITGANGFVGRYLIRALEDLGFDVFGVAGENKEGSKKICVLDIGNKKSIDDFFKKEKFSAIFHLAAMIPDNTDSVDSQKIISTNIFGTLNLLQASLHNSVGRFIYSSSASVYNRKETPVPAREEHHSSPENIYGLTKLAGENLCEIFRRNYNMSTVSLRYSSIYGFGQRQSSVLPVFMERAIRNRDIEIHGRGNRTQDFIYVKDVVSANIKAFLSGAEGVFNIGSGKEVSMLKLAQSVLKTFPESKSKIKKRKIAKKEDESSFFFDISKAKRELNFSPAYSLEAGLLEYGQELKSKSYENRYNI